MMRALPGRAQSRRRLGAGAGRRARALRPAGAVGDGASPRHGAAPATRFARPSWPPPEAAGTRSPTRPSASAPGGHRHLRQRRRRSNRQGRQARGEHQRRGDLDAADATGRRLAGARHRLQRRPPRLGGRSRRHGRRDGNGGVTWKTRRQTGTLSPRRQQSRPARLCLDPVDQADDQRDQRDGPAWTPEATTLTPYPTSPSIVAGQQDGDFAAAIDGNGVLITRASDGTWTSQTGPFPAGSAVLGTGALAGVGQRRPDLFAIAASDVQGSDDQGASFQDLTPPAGRFGLSSGAFLGAPRPSSSSAGVGPARALCAGQRRVGDRHRRPDRRHSSRARPAPAASPMPSRAAGHVERTLSYGAAPSPWAPRPARHGRHRGALQSLVGARPGHAGAAGAARRRGLEGGPRLALVGEPGDPRAVSLKPLATTQYRLGFVLGGRTVAVSGT